jgi:hypothetical protein
MVTRRVQTRLERKRTDTVGEPVIRNNQIAASQAG